jgi:hypothetical protein
VTKAVEVTAVENGVLRGKDVASGKTVTVKVSADAQLKRLPDFAAMMASRRGPGGQGPGAGMPPGGPMGGAMGGPMGGMMGAGGPPDPAQMIERMPASRFEDFKAGETIVVSSTAGARGDELNAIMILGNAEMMLRMMSMQRGGGPGGGPGGGGPGGMPGGGGMPMGMMMDLPAMMMQ